MFFFFKQKTAYEMRISDWSSDVCSSDLLHQLRRAVGADDRDLQRLFDLALGPALGQGQDPEQQRRHQQRPHHQRQHQRAAVARELAQFLEANRPQRTHACSPSSEPISVTKASSRLSWPVCARSSSAVPCAATRPLAITTMRSHSAATSCMMWLEKITQRPSARRSLRKPRSPRVVITSRPLVGSSRITLRGSCTRDGVEEQTAE